MFPRLISRLSGLQVCVGSHHLLLPDAFLQRAELLLDSRVLPDQRLQTLPGQHPPQHQLLELGRAGRDVHHHDRKQHRRLDLCRRPRGTGALDDPLLFYFGYYVL